MIETKVVEYSPRSYFFFFSTMVKSKWDNVSDLPRLRPMLPARHNITPTHHRLFDPSSSWNTEKKKKRNKSKWTKKKKEENNFNKFWYLWFYMISMLKLPATSSPSSWANSCLILNLCKEMRENVSLFIVYGPFLVDDSKYRTGWIWTNHSTAPPKMAYHGPQYNN